jgi:hypothetical protein
VTGRGAQGGAGEQPRIKVDTGRLRARGELSGHASAAPGVRAGRKKISGRG